MDKEKILNMAKLARIALSDSEAESLSKEFDNILAYVSEVKGATIDLSAKAKNFVNNVMRADGEPHKSGIFTDDILRQAPAREGNYVKVKKIL